MRQVTADKCENGRRNGCKRTFVPFRLVVRYRLPVAQTQPHILASKAHLSITLWPNVKPELGGGAPTAQRLLVTLQSELMSHRHEVHRSSMQELGLGISCEKVDLIKPLAGLNVICLSDFASSSQPNGVVLLCK